MHLYRRYLGQRFPMTKRDWKILRRRAKIKAVRFQDLCVGYDGDAWDRKRWRV